MPRKHKKKKKTPKEKVVYYDDNSTIVDMSNVTAPGEKRRNNQTPPRRSTAKEKWKTYWSAVKTMFVPMLIVLGVMTAVFLVIYLIALKNG